MSPLGNSTQEGTPCCRRQPSRQVRHTAQRDKAQRRLGRQRKMSRIYHWGKACSIAPNGVHRSIGSTSQCKNAVDRIQQLKRDSSVDYAAIQRRQRIGGKLFERVRTHTMRCCWSGKSPRRTASARPRYRDRRSRQHKWAARPRTGAVGLQRARNLTMFL